MKNQKNLNSYEQRYLTLTNTESRQMLKMYDKDIKMPIIKIPQQGIILKQKNKINNNNNKSLYALNNNEDEREKSPSCKREQLKLSSTKEKKKSGSRTCGTVTRSLAPEYQKERNRSTVLKKNLKK